MPVDRLLHHFPLDPFSRQVRLALGEKRLPFREAVVRYWEQPEELLRLNPSGLPPVLVESGPEGVLVLCESRAILDRLESVETGARLLAEEPLERAETLRLVQWFDRKFDSDVNGLLLHEKMEKRLLGLGAPELALLRRGREALRAHLGYLDRLAGERDWLAGGRLSWADFAAAAHLSVVDYVGEAPWDDFPAAKTWYARIKSRPAFRPLLADRQPGLPPAAHYDDLDF